MTIKEKARAAPLMKTRILCRIFRCQFFPMLNTVNRLVFRTVIHKQPLDILHPGNTQNISDKNKYPDNAFHNSQNQRRIRYLPKQSGNKKKKEAP